MFDFSKSKVVEWSTGPCPGRYEFISCHSEMGELSLKLMRQDSDQERVAIEILAVPLWHCIVGDESHQTQLLHQSSANLLEVLGSPVISGFSKNEPLFEHTGEGARHWVVLTMAECIHIVATEEPSVRIIFGGDAK